MTTQQPSTRKELATFLGLTFSVSMVFYCLILTSSSISEGQAFIPGLMWTPGLSAMVTGLIFHRSVRGLGWRWPGTRWAALAYFLPLAYAASAYGVIWLVGLGRVDISLFKENPPLFVLGGSVLFLLMAAGEEIGWRGFLVPALARTMQLGRIVLVSGAIWVVYHAPLILFGEYHNLSSPRWYSTLCFSVMATSVALILAWLRLRTASVWPAAILHASHGLYVQAFFDQVTVDTGATHWFTGEFGAALAVTTAVTAWVFWRARAQVSLPDRSKTA